MSYGIAIDIGTTTLCAALVRSYDGGVLREESRLNSGRMFGADVISRIRAASDGSLLMLQDCMRRDLTALLTKLVTPDVASYVNRIVIAANTTMLHILRGYPCAELGRFPYTPVTLEYEVLTLQDILPKVTFLAPKTEVVLFPGFTAFVGADIVAGVYWLTEKYDRGTGTVSDFPTFLLLDLGTNGEMALVEQSGHGARRISVCSTAAGPVFEGGGISCGMGGVDGAIAHVRLGAECDIIGGGKPLGLCGTGVLETVSELRRTGILDETGLMKEPYFKLGYTLVNAEDSGTGQRIAFTQEDVRAVQMAKAAIRAGLETLLKVTGISADTIDAVYVAGGYGQHMDFDAIRALDMIPKALLPKCRAALNTSLSGCIRLLEDLALAEDESAGNASVRTASQVLSDLRDLARNKNEVVLATTDDFEERYYGSMGL